MKYFAYGSNMDVEQMACRCGEMVADGSDTASEILSDWIRDESCMPRTVNLPNQTGDWVCNIRPYGVKMNYDADYFIKKFEAIPEEKWCVEEIVSLDGSRCARGHCGIDSDGDNETEEDDCLWKLFLDSGLGVEGVNDKSFCEYQQDTPKQRILAALLDIKQNGIAKVEPV